jgi:hypothetical protein
VQGPNINQRKVNRGGLTHVPSPRWLGAVIMTLLLLSMATLFTYALLDWDWQQRQGSDNYWVAGIELLLFGFTLRAWRNDPRRLFGPGDLGPDGTPGGA